MGLSVKIKEWIIKGSSLVKFDFSSLKNLIQADKNKLKLFSNNKVGFNVNIDKSTKIIYVNTSKLNSSEEKSLADVLKELKDTGYTILDDKSHHVLEDLRSEEDQDENKKILGFFKDKVPPEDLEIIRAALYIKACFVKNINIDELKSGIRQRHGQRGNNIVNLYSARYFENYFIPFYNYLCKNRATEADAKREFYTVFDLVARELPFVVFVCYRKTADEVKDEVLAKFKYGMGIVNIHGIGPHNVITIKDALAEIEKVYGSDKLDISTKEEKKQIIHVRIEIKSNAELDTTKTDGSA